MKYIIVDLEMNPVSNEYPNERKVDLRQFRLVQCFWMRSIRKLEVL